MCCGPHDDLCLRATFLERRTADARYKVLQESAHLVMNVDDISSINSELEGKLVHMTGEVTPGADVHDAIFRVITNGLLSFVAMFKCITGLRLRARIQPRIPEDLPPLQLLIPAIRNGGATSSIPKTITKKRVTVTPLS